MQLSKSAFQAFLDGRKTSEARLLDRKRSAISVGDHIRFSCSATRRSIRAEVGALHYYDKFQAMYEDLGPQRFGHKEVADALREVTEFYPKDVQKRHHVVGIDCRIID